MPAPTHTVNIGKRGCRFDSRCHAKCQKTTHVAMGHREQNVAPKILTADEHHRPQVQCRPTSTLSSNTTKTARAVAQANALIAISRSSPKSAQAQRHSRRSKPKV